jgi:hypothetical protein
MVFCFIISDPPWFSDFSTSIRSYFTHSNFALVFARDCFAPHFDVGAFYWTALAPEIVNSGREEQGSVSV